MGRKMKKALLLFFFITTLLLAQGTNPRYYQPRKIVDKPNAGLLADRSWMGEFRIGEGGGLIGSAGLGLWGRLQFGFSYGAYGVLGRDEPIAYPRPEFEAKVRPFNETISFPAIVFGYAGQGNGAWDDSLKRYEMKSTGIFLCASKNWATIGGNLGAHLGMNYSFENKDEEGFNAYIGIDKNLGEMFAFSIEYDAAINDRNTKDGRYGSGKGYLNGSIKWSVRTDFEIELIFMDLLLNSENSESFSREVRLSFFYPL